MARTAVLLLAAFLATPALAQSPREFETASIKPYAPTGPISEACNSHSDPLMLGLTGCTLKQLITLAYHLKDYELQAKGPPWIETDPYSIQARTTVSATRSEMMLMLQPILTSRFHLQVRWETQPASVYLLQVAGHGLKLQPATKLDHCGAVFFRPGIIKSDCVSMDDIGELLESVLKERPVINRTDTSKESKYQINLEYSAAADPSGVASLFSVLSDQAGLAAKAGKAPLRMLIVDRAERPHPN